MCFVHKRQNLGSNLSHLQMPTRNNRKPQQTMHDPAAMHWGQSLDAKYTYLLMPGFYCLERKLLYC